MVILVVLRSGENRRSRGIVDAEAGRPPFQACRGGLSAGSGTAIEVGTKLRMCEIAEAVPLRSEREGERLPIR